MRMNYEKKSKKKYCSRKERAQLTAITNNKDGYYENKCFNFYASNIKIFIYSNRILFCFFWVFMLECIKSWNCHLTKKTDMHTHGFCTVFLYFFISHTHSLIRYTDCVCVFVCVFAAAVIVCHIMAINTDTHTHFIKVCISTEFEWNLHAYINWCKINNTQHKRFYNGVSSCVRAFMATMTTRRRRWLGEKGERVW